MKGPSSVTYVAHVKPRPVLFASASEFWGTAVSKRFLYLAQVTVCVIKKKTKKNEKKKKKTKT
mgnify:CR=1 FL=1